jgi:uncharacterized Zn-finger protein
MLCTGGSPLQEASTDGCSLDTQEKGRGRGMKLSGGTRIVATCPFCNKTFNNSSALAKHKLTHSDERKYLCNVCHKAFKRQDHL